MNAVDSLFATLFTLIAMVGLAYFAKLLYCAFSNRVSERSRDEARSIIETGFASGKATLIFLIGSLGAAGAIAMMGMPLMATVTAIITIIGALMQPVMFIASTRFQ